MWTAFFQSGQTAGWNVKANVHSPSWFQYTLTGQIIVCWFWEYHWRGPSKTRWIDTALWKEQDKEQRSSHQHCTEVPTIYNQYQTTVPIQLVTWIQLFHLFPGTYEVFWKTVKRRQRRWFCVLLHCSYILGATSLMLLLLQVFTCFFADQLHQLFWG